MSEKAKFIRREADMSGRSRRSGRVSQAVSGQPQNTTPSFTVAMPGFRGAFLKHLSYGLM